MSPSSLGFRLLLVILAGSQAHTVIRPDSSFTSGIPLDSPNENREREALRNWMEFPSRVTQDVHLPPGMSQDVHLPPGMAQHDLDRLQASRPLTFVDVNRFPLARCMDGSAAGFYWKQTSNETTKNNWIIHLQGGGECDTPIRCQALKFTPLGSSLLFPQYHNFYSNVDVQVSEDHIIVSTMGVVNSRESLNPEFFDWNMVFIPYCSQDLWVGQQTTLNLDTWGVYFYGRHILDAIIDTLDLQGMDKAENLVFSGDSAGGYGVFANVDKLALKHPGAKTVGNPIGGLWTYAYPYTGFGHTWNKFSDFRESNWPKMKDIWNASYNEACKLEPTHSVASCMVGCSIAPFPWTHIKTPLFITEANSDSVLATMHNWIPDPPLTFSGLHDPQLYGLQVKSFLERFGKNMTQCLKDGMDLMRTNKKFNIGIFSPSCYIHTDFTNISINGRSYVDAFADFFFERGEPPVLIEEGFLTNPSCSKQAYATVS